MNEENELIVSHKELFSFIKNILEKKGISLERRLISELNEIAVALDVKPLGGEIQI
jgi:hypothetical protein